MSTYRRTPKDLQEVTYIRGLIGADVASQATTLASGSKDDLNKLRDLMNIAAKWDEIYADLTKPAAAKSEPAEPKADAPPSEPRARR